MLVYRVKDLRLQLLDVERNHHLVKSLYGLLMLLPQSDAFRTLQRRLHCVPSTTQLASTPSIDHRSAFFIYSNIGNILT